LTKQLLERGYTVRATVRDRLSPSIAHLSGLGKALPGKLEIIEADLILKGAFDKAMEGAKYV
jgi:GDP-D-mannose dehydratase